MEFKLKHANKIVTLFILIAIVILIATLVFTGDITDLFSSKYFITSVFKDTSGLSPGVPVTLKDLDIEIGKVERVGESNARGEVTVVYSILRNYADSYLKRDTISFLEYPAIPVIGGNTRISLTIGEDSKRLIPLNNNGNPIIDDIYIPSNQTNEGQIMLTKDFYEEEGISEINAIISNIEKLTSDLSNNDGPLYQTLANVEEITNPTRSEILRNTNLLLSSVASLTKKLDDGDIEELLGEDIYVEIVDILNEVENTIKIIQDDTLSNINNAIIQQNRNISNLINESVKGLIDNEITNLLNQQISPAITQVSNSVDTISTELDQLLYSVNGLVSNTTSSVNELVDRTSERINVITEELSDSVLGTLSGITNTVTELENTILTEVTVLLDELTTTVYDNVNPAIGEITEDFVLSFDTITKGLTETVNELQLVIGEEARYLIRDLSSKIQNILTTVDEISMTASDILNETAPDIAQSIKSLSEAMEGLPELVESLTLVLDTADMTLKRLDIVLEKLDSILSGYSEGDSLPIPGRTGGGSIIGDD